MAGDPERSGTIKEGSQKVNNHQKSEHHNPYYLS